MVDILSTRVQAVYTKCERGFNRAPQLDTKLTLSANNCKRQGIQFRREKARDTSLEHLQQVRDNTLFRAKESPWMGFPVRQPRPLMGMACGSCTPNSKDTLASSGPRPYDVQNILKTDEEQADSFWTRTFCHLMHNYQLTKFDYPQVAGTVMDEDRLKDAVEQTAQEIAGETGVDVDAGDMYKQIFTAQEARARKILYDMGSTLSDFFLRLTSWLLYKLLPRFLTSVCLHPSQLAMLKRAANTNLPLIFVPLHRSHLDYILITFILLNINVRCPLVAAGNNLRIPVFGWLLRHLGAFFIKRRMDPVSGRKDVVYRAVLHTYMMQCLSAGHNIEFYIEGGRTRTGKPCMPKGGLLSVIVDAYMDGTVEDALLVPVSVNYDKLVDGNFITELSGQPKTMETFGNAMTSIWTVLNSNYGSMRIDFNQPFSLRELVKSFQAMHRTRQLSHSESMSDMGSDTGRNGFTRDRGFHSIPSTTSIYGTDVAEEHRMLVENIARHLLYDCSRACAVMSTNALAFLLLNKFREGVKMDQLVETFDRLRQDLVWSNKDVGYSGDSIDIINNAIRLLGPGLVKRERQKVPNSTDTVEMVTPVTLLPNVIELSYYSNALLPHFALEGVVATAVCSTAECTGVELKVTQDDIISRALDICEILQFEFVFSKPCQRLDVAIMDVIQTYQALDILIVDQVVDTNTWGPQFSKVFDNEDEDDSFIQNLPCPTYSVSAVTDAVNKLKLFHMTLRPLLDAYVITAKCLHRLVDRQVPESDFVQEVLAEIRAQLNSGYCCYGEAYSVDPIKNAFKLLKHWGVLEMYTQNSVRLVYLADSFNAEHNTTQVLDRISRYKWPATA